MSNFLNFCWIIRTQPISLLKLLLLYQQARNSMTSLTLIKKLQQFNCDAEKNELFLTDTWHISGFLFHVNQHDWSIIYLGVIHKLRIFFVVFKNLRSSKETAFHISNTIWACFKYASFKSIRKKCFMNGPQLICSCLTSVTSWNLKQNP